MDPSATDSVLQKTLPDIDPAVFYRFATEVSAQATVLATQQQQLNHLTSLTEELVRSLRALHLPAPSMNASPQNPPPPASATASATASPRLAFPEKFDGSPTRCKGFLLHHVYRPAAHAISHGRQPLSSVRYYRDERWNGPLPFGKMITLHSPHSPASLRTSRRCSSIPLVVKKLVNNNCCLSVREEADR